jgi:hypothetical protein
MGRKSKTYGSLILGRRDAGQAAEFDDSVQRSELGPNQTAVAGGGGSRPV